MATNSDFANINKAVGEFERAYDGKRKAILELCPKIKDEKMPAAKKAYVDEMKKIAQALQKNGKTLEGKIKTLTKDVKGEDKSISQHLKGVAGHLSQMSNCPSLKIGAKQSGNLLTITVNVK